MAELRPIPIEQLLHRILEEPRRQGTLFDFPLRKAYRPAGDVDLSVDVHGHHAQTPVGPAAGPHAQLAQNIVLAWLGGARVIELKTVQILDELKIPRPCIDAATIGFNVEWSQELRLHESLREYVAGWMLLRILRELDPLGLGAERVRAAEPIFELSVGYDFKGLSSPVMRDYLKTALNVAPVIDELRPRLPAAYRDIDYRSDMISCVTLSTFHGCPPEEIEKIARYLMNDIGVDVIVKLNPTLLGYDEVLYLLHERMGYHELRPRRAAFDSDLTWEGAVALGRALSGEAARIGRTFGVKMTNTLVVDNHKTFFSDKEMYLSGAPLHVLAMHCVDRWRAALGTGIPLSFSGGIDQHNFADAVACDLVPVTTCTDLLRPGGYARLPRYLTNLEEAMRESGARDLTDFLLRRFDKGAEAVRGVFSQIREEGERWAGIGADGRARAEALLAELECACLDAVRRKDRSISASITEFREQYVDISHPDEIHGSVGVIADSIVDHIVRAAGMLNAHEVTARVTGDPRYAAGKNSKPPRKVGSHLVLLDCLSCDKCVPVCPNNAMFAVDTPPEEIAGDDIVLDEAGALTRVPGASLWKVTRPQQWANFADACNECGNCDVFCPEDGGPFVMKSRWFGSRASMDQSPGLDGVYLEKRDADLFATARIGGAHYQLLVPPEGPAILDDGRVRAEYDPQTGALLGARPHDGARGPHRLPAAVFLSLRALVKGALDPAHINPVSASLPGARWPGAAPAAPAG